MTIRAEKIIRAGINAVMPNRLIREHLNLNSNTLKAGSIEIPLKPDTKIFAVGFGKASGIMAGELEKILGNRLSRGHVTVKYGHPAPCARITVGEAGHPVPDENTLKSSAKIFDIALSARENDIVICLISGGGSALFEKLPPEISLGDLQKTSEALIGSGAEINEINTVRKHLSLAKGGRLADAIYPARCLSIILSDVVGDKPEAISSGPTAPDDTSPQDALDVIVRHGIEKQIPPGVIEYLKSGPATQRAAGKAANLIIGGNSLALEAAERKALEMGYDTRIIERNLQCPAHEAAERLLAEARNISRGKLKKPACVLMGGETTVVVRGKGKGGRNQELALYALSKMSSGDKNILIASCGTDGTDGPTDAAGGIATAEALAQAAKKRLNPEKHLADNNAYEFLKQTSGLIKTGPTGTNVMDIMLALVE